jgi:hypothetical protein
MFVLLKILKIHFFEIVLEPNELTIRSEILYGNITNQALYDHYIIKQKKSNELILLVPFHFLNFVDFGSLPFFGPFLTKIGGSTYMKMQISQ